VQQRDCDDDHRHEDRNSIGDMVSIASPPVVPRKMLHGDASRQSGNRIENFIAHAAVEPDQTNAITFSERTHCDNEHASRSESAFIQEQFRQNQSKG